MFKENKLRSEMTNTVIGKETRLEAAKITGSESVRIDGKYIGDIDIDGDLVIGTTGCVFGDIHALHIKVAGRVKGNIKSGTVVHIAPTALIDGNIETVSLIVDEGGHINGNCQMSSNIPSENLEMSSSEAV